MKLSEDKIERLLFVKYLLAQAEKQKDQSRPFSSSTILILHDLVEIFLQVSYEHLTQKSRPKNNNILDSYSNEINTILAAQGKSSINLAYIKRLNELRNQLKHSTIFIDQKNILNIFQETKTFTDDFTPEIFQISFLDISLMQLIENPEVKTFLTIAEESLAKEQYHICVINSAKAFFLYKNSVSNQSRLMKDLPQKFQHRRVNYLRKIELKNRSQQIDVDLRRAIYDIGHDINQILSELDDFREIELLSVDLQEYGVFTMLTPYIYYDMEKTEGQKKTLLARHEDKFTADTYKRHQAEFCFNFAFEAILNGQYKAYA